MGDGAFTTMGGRLVCGGGDLAGGMLSLVDGVCRGGR